ncbi:MAG TPA: cation:proton antiporter [Tepidisphaeraceae bacterium]
MNWTIGYICVGALLLIVALGGTLLKRLPLTTAVIYLVIGFIAGPHVLGWVRLDVVENAHLLERLTEVVVLISLFVAGLKLRVPLRDGRWFLPLRLASLSMLITIGLITLTGVYLLGLSWGAAVLLAAALAPTDPVLASDVQVDRPGDEDNLRFALTAEAGINDGMAFPFVMLGLHLLHLFDPNHGIGYWFGVDLIWAVLAGLAVGAICGTLVGKLVVYLRQTHREAVGLDEFLALGLMALSYGIALQITAYGFLAVFAAGLSLRKIEARANNNKPLQEVEVAAHVPKAADVATDKETAPAFMAHAILGFNEQVERLSELAIVLLIGAMLTSDYLPREAIWFVPLLFLVIRPLSVWVSLIGTRRKPAENGLIAWFGIRGVGSLYYLTYAIAHGVAEDDARYLTAILLTTVAASILIHGISSTPLMNFYEKATTHRAKPGQQPAVDSA